MAYSKIEGRKLTVTMNMKKSESKSAPYILHGRGRGLGDDWIENADGLRPIPPTAELRELEPFVGRGRHRLLPPGGEKEALIGQLHGRGNVRQQNQIDRTRRRQRRRDDGLHRYLGLLNHSALLLLPTLNIPSIRWRDSRSRTRKLHPIPSLLSHASVLRTTFFLIKTKNKKNKKVSSYIPLLLWKQRIEYNVIFYEFYFFGYAVGWCRWACLQCGATAVSSLIMWESPAQAQQGWFDMFYTFEPREAFSCDITRPFIPLMLNGLFITLILSCYLNEWSIF